MKSAIILSAMLMLQIMQVTTVETSLFYYEFDESGQESFIEDVIEFEYQGNVEANMEYILQRLFDNHSNLYSAVPEGVNITNILYINGSLDVEVSKDIMNYGGTAREIAMVKQILATVFAYDKVETFTLLIEENGKLLVEGTEINGYTRDEWEERIE